VEPALLAQQLGYLMVGVASIQTIGGSRLPPMKS